jgi:hypothetical protein
VWRRIIDAIPAEAMSDLRDRALIGTLTYSFMRIGVGLKKRVEDLDSDVVPETPFAVAGLNGGKMIRETVECCSGHRND